MNPGAALAWELPRISSWLISLFAVYNHHYLGRHFHSLRILKDGLPKHDRPTVIFLNHASWWDPLVCMFLARTFFPGRCSFAPIDAQMLGRYRLFKRLGFFGIKPGSAGGALAFIRSVHCILSSPTNMLWLTPQGRFADARERPPRLRSGLGAIASRLTAATFLPLAIECTFWTEPKCEILVSFGEPIVTRSVAARAPNEWTTVLARALEKAQDDLARAAERREAHDWIVLRGSSRIHADSSQPSFAREKQEFSAVQQTSWIKS